MSAIWCNDRSIRRLKTPEEFHLISFVLLLIHSHHLSFCNQCGFDWGMPLHVGYNDEPNIIDVVSVVSPQSQWYLLDLLTRSRFLGM